MTPATEDTIAIPYLFFVVGVLPALGFFSWDYLRSHKTGPKKKRYSRAIFMQVWLLAFTLVAAKAENINLLPTKPPSASASISGLLFLIILLVRVRLSLQRLDDKTKGRLALFLPETQREFWFWVPISLLAGAGEECAYRGVAYRLLVLVSQSARFALLVCVVAFAVAHLYQGWKSAITLGVLGFASHVAVFVTGSLFLSIAVHAIYDLSLGWFAVRSLSAEGLERTQSASG